MWSLEGTHKDIRNMLSVDGDERTVPTRYTVKFNDSMYIVPTFSLEPLSLSSLSQEMGEEICESRRRASIGRFELIKRKWKGSLPHMTYSR